MGWSCSGPVGASGRFKTRLVKNPIPLHRSIPASLGCSPPQFREGRGRERSLSLGVYAVAVVAVRTASFFRISVSSTRLGCLAGKLQASPCLCHPGTGISNAHHYAQLFGRFSMGSGDGLAAIQISHRLRCLPRPL